MEDYLLYILKLNILAAIMILLILGVSIFLNKKYSVWWRSILWLGISVILLLPVQIPDSWSVIHIQIPQIADTREDTSGNKENPSVIKKEKESEAQLSESNESGGKTAVQNLPTERQSYSTGSRPAGAGSAVSVLFFLWLAGVTVYGVYRILGSYVVQRELKRWSMPVRDKSLEMDYQRLCKEMKVKHPPKLRMNAKLTTPLLSGVLRPYIYLPSDQFTKKELELLLRHEVSHYQHRDLWYKLILQLVCMVYWFNPALHLMKRKAEQDLEFLCDERVTKNGVHEERMQYNYLLAQTAVRSRSFYGLSTGFNGNLANLKKRMVNIMKAGKKKKGAVLTVCFLGLFVCANVMTGCSTKKPQDTSVNSVASVSDSDVEEPSVSAAPEATPEPTEALTTEPLPTATPTPEPEKTQPDTEDVQQPSDTEITEPENDDPDENPSDSDTGETDENEETIEPVKAKVNVYEGEYNQSNLYSGAPGTANEGYIVKVTNVTDTSFDFTIYLYTFDPDTSIQNEDLVFKTHTAVFIDDGTKAIYDGIDYDLTFTFPDYHSAYPEATDMEISGYAPVEGETFMNNQIPGHGFS